MNVWLFLNVNIYLCV